MFDFSFLLKRNTLERDDFSTLDHANLSVKLYLTAAKNLSVGFF
jgi:hypothetical protein